MNSEIFEKKVIEWYEKALNILNKPINIVRETENELEFILLYGNNIKEIDQLIEEYNELVNLAIEHDSKNELYKEFIINKKYENRNIKLEKFLTMESFQTILAYHNYELHNKLNMFVQVRLPKDSKSSNLKKKEKYGPAINLPLDLLYLKILRYRNGLEFEEPKKSCENFIISIKKMINYIDDISEYTDYKNSLKLISAKSTKSFLTDLMIGKYK